MPLSYFAYSSQLHQSDPSGTLKRTIAREFYQAEAYLRGDIDATDLRKSRAGPLPIFKANFRGRAVCGVRRTWQDIRRDSKQFCLLWFPVTGSVSIRQNGQHSVVTGEEFAITYSDRPFEIEALPDDSLVHESYQIAVPVHLMNVHVPQIEKLGGSRFPLSHGNALFAKRTYAALFDEAEFMSEKAIDAFVTASLAALAETLRGECVERVNTYNIKRVRLKNLREYIDFHLSNPGLTAAKVAEECGISPRYMHLLFKEAGMTFRDYTWNQRLKRAHDWLTSDAANSESISHIAFTAGYRSVSHFSRSFKTAYGYTPTQARGIRQRPAMESQPTAA